MDIERSRVTSTARRDIADAKNMQITIPANVLYLGPINSSAGSKEKRRKKR